MRYLRHLSFQWTALILVLAMPLTAVIGVLLHGLAEDSRAAALTLVQTIARGIGTDVDRDLRQKEQLMAYILE